MVINHLRELFFRIYRLIMTGWWFQTFVILHNTVYGNVILPIDELHHFSRCLLHHQPDKEHLCDLPHHLEDC